MQISHWHATEYAFTYFGYPLLDQSEVSIDIAQSCTPLCTPQVQPRCDGKAAAAVT